MIILVCVVHRRTASSVAAFGCGPTRAPALARQIAACRRAHATQTRWSRCSISTTPCSTTMRDGRSARAISSPRSAASARRATGRSSRSCAQQLGYADYLGALQRYRVENPRDPHLLGLSIFLIDYPFANRLYPGSLDVIEHLKRWGPAVILSDGDAVFQPRKIDRSGILRGGRRQHPHLRPQGAGARRRRAPLSRQTLRADRRQAAHARRRSKAHLGRACHHRLPAPGSLCASIRRRLRQVPRHPTSRSSASASSWTSTSRRCWLPRARRRRSPHAGGANATAATADEGKALPRPIGR